MARYSFEAYASDGSLVRDALEAASEDEALERLLRRGLTPVSVGTDMAAATPWYARDIRLGAPRVPEIELERAITTLATMLGAALPMPRALAFARDRAQDRTLRAILDRMLGVVRDGGSLAEAADAEAALPERLTFLIRLGERTDRLAEVLSQAAERMREEAVLRREMRSALVYPMILLAMSALVVALLVFFLAPTLLPVFRAAGGTPPPLLAALGTLGDVARDGWPFVVAGLAGAIFLGLTLRRVAARALGRLALRLPFTGSWLRKARSAEVAGTLALILSSGATAQEAVAAAAETTPHPAHGERLRAIAAELRRGGDLLTASADAPEFDPLLVSMIEAGAETDRLADLLAVAARALAAEAREGLGRALKLAAPILTLVIGLGVGALILSVMTAILDLNTIAF